MTLSILYQIHIHTDQRYCALCHAYVQAVSTATTTQEALCREVNAAYHDLRYREAQWSVQHHRSLSR